jgi:hypothetical protein
MWISLVEPEPQHGLLAQALLNINAHFFRIMPYQKEGIIYLFTWYTIRDRITFWSLGA